MATGVASLGEIARRCPEELRRMLERLEYSAKLGEGEGKVAMGIASGRRGLENRDPVPHAVIHSGRDDRIFCRL